jgi:acetoin utilization deacetylase AcuC-like enzyme
MLVFHSPDAVLHDPHRFYRRGVTMPHPESAQRYLTLRDAVIAQGHELIAAEDHSLEPLLAVHDAAYLDFLENAWTMAMAIDPTLEEIVTTQFARGPMMRRPQGFNGLVSYHSADTSTAIRAGSWAAAYGAAQAALTAADALAQSRAAYALSRPPGHHAAADHSSGFCFINNAAVAANHLARKHGRVAMLDIDVHHGDGTQGLFYARSDVLTVSLHAQTDNYFPYFTGYADETGAGEGEGYNLNMPLPHGSGDEPYLDAIRRGLDRIARHDAGALVISLGLDAADEDPVGVLDVTTEGFRRAAELIATMDLPVLLVQEGGYPCEALGRNLAAFLSGFESVASRG